MSIDCPVYVKSCIERLGAAGYSAYAVGGAVRDSLLGLKAHDWDIATNAPPSVTLSLFSDMKTVPTGLKHGTVTVIFKNGYDRGIPVEITTFRIDGEYTDKRHPSSVTFADRIEDDLSRRDLTVNAMAYNEERGLIDPFGGKDDLKNKVIRCVGDPEKRFSEDALRILRAFRFSAQLGFSIEKETLDAASRCSPLIGMIARERIGNEFVRLLSAPDPSYSLRLMIKCGVFSSVFPSIDPPDERVIGILPLLSHKDGLLRLGATAFRLDDRQKEELLSSLRLSNDQKKCVRRLCRAALFMSGKEGMPDMSPRGARIFLSLFNDMTDNAIEMMTAFACDPDAARAFSSLVWEEKSKRPCLRINDLAVSGEDLIPLFGGDRPKIGKTLSALLSYVIEEPEKNEKEALLKYAETFCK